MSLSKSTKGLGHDTSLTKIVAFSNIAQRPTPASENQFIELLE